MSEKKTKRSFHLTDSEVDYIVDFQNKTKLSRNLALSKILDEHKRSSNISSNEIYKILAKEIAAEIINTLKPQLNSLKFSNNSISKDTQILLELINGIYFKEDYQAIPSTEKNKTRALEQSIDVVETRIAKAHYRKSNTLD